VIEELKALKLERGCVYAIEVQNSMPHEQFMEMQENVRKCGDALGLTFILLGPNLKVARARIAELPALEPQL